MMIIIVYSSTPSSSSSSYLFHGYQKGTSPLIWLPQNSKTAEIKQRKLQKVRKKRKRHLMQLGLVSHDAVQSCSYLSGPVESLWVHAPHTARNLQSIIILVVHSRYRHTHRRSFIILTPPPSGID